jgi:F-type H+-transporting ATPase subunit a
MLHISPRAEEIFFVGGLPITNALILTLVVFILLGVVSLIFRRKLALVPGRFQNVFEFIIDNVLDMMEPLYGSKRKAEKYLPWIATFFIFILFSNWLGLVPGVGSIGIKHGEVITPLLRAPASDLNFTLALAFISVIIIQVFGVMALGPKIHFSKFFDFRGPIKFFIGILELVSEIAKIISFSFRLFGNVFAGEVLLIIIGFLVPYVIPVPFLIFEVFVGFMQAFVFSMLTMVFVAMAIKEDSSH